jgi:Methylase involved in ubiquinone/menaquinone biosynthesis
MTMIRPGGEALTKKAIELAKLQSGARVLDMGCGEGDTVALLKDEYGFEAIGIDTSSKLIAKGKKRREGIDLRCMEAHALEFESFEFDAVFMECSLSVFRLQEDAVFEAYCLLKPGGKLIVTDLFVKDPDPDRVKEMVKDARERASKPKVHNDCDENENPSFVMLDGAFVMSELADMVEGIGFVIDYFEEVENALSNFMAQAIMGHGSLEEYFKAVVPEGADPSKFCADCAFKDPKQLGYFLMIMRKPENNI